MALINRFEVVHRRASDRKSHPATSGEGSPAQNILHPSQVEEKHFSSDVSDALSCSFSYDSDILAVATSNGSVKLLHSLQNYKPASFEISSSLCRGEAMRSAVTGVRFRPGPDRTTKDLMLCGSTDGTVTEWHLGSVQLLFSHKQEGNEVYSVDYAPNGMFFCSTGKDGKVYVYDQPRKANIATLEFTSVSDTYAAHSSRVQCCRWFDQNTIITGGWDNTIQFWDVRAGKAVNRIFGAYICGDGLDAHDNIVVSGSTRPKNGLQLWDRRNYQSLCEFTYPIAPQTEEEPEPYPSNLFCAKFSEDGLFLAAGGSLDFRIFDVKKTFATAEFTVPSTAASSPTEEQQAAAAKNNFEPDEVGRVLNAGGVNAAVFACAWSHSNMCAAVGYGASVNVLRKS